MIPRKTILIFLFTRVLHVTPAGKKINKILDVLRLIVATQRRQCPTDLGMLQNKEKRDGVRDKRRRKKRSENERTRSGWPSSQILIFWFTRSWPSFLPKRPLRVCISRDVALHWFSVFFRMLLLPMHLYSTWQRITLSVFTPYSPLNNLTNAHSVLYYEFLFITNSISKLYINTPQKKKIFFNC